MLVGHVVEPQWKGAYTKVSSAMVVPTGRRVHEPSGVQLSNPLGQLKLGVIFSDLAPGFVVNDLQIVVNIRIFLAFTKHLHLPKSQY